MIKFANDDKRIRFFFSLLIALIGGITFAALHTPIPWLLGPMAAVLIGSRFRKVQFYWPSTIRDIGLVIVGYSVGLSFTKEALLEIMAKLPSMLLMTVLLVCFCAGIAFIVSKLTGVDYPTVLIGSIPGGLSQMIIFAEELKGINITTVTFLQVARLIMIIFFVPFLILGPLFNNTTNKALDLVNNGTVSPIPLFQPSFGLLLFVLFVHCLLEN
ncbi:MAG: AbrB family transcriptional regulator [Bacillus sp. (in: firmicutes)]